MLPSWGRPKSTSESADWVALRMSSCGIANRDSPHTALSRPLLLILLFNNAEPFAVSQHLLADAFSIGPLTIVASLWTVNWSFRFLFATSKAAVTAIS